VQAEVQVPVGIGVGGRATDSKYEERSGSAGRGTSSIVNRCGWAGSDSRYEKRSGSAGRGTSACVNSCGWTGYGS